MPTKTKKMEANFNNLPQMVLEIHTKVLELEKIISKIENPKESDDLVGLEGACSILGLTAQSIYALVSRGKLPSHKQGKRLYFFRSELLQWVKAGRRSKKEELTANPRRNLKPLKQRERV